MALVGKITGLVSGLLEDQSKLDMIISKGFSHFDKDASGFIESNEISTAVQHVLTLAHLPQVPSHLLNSVFAKVAGADQKIDKAEFVTLFRTLLGKIKHDPAPVAQAAAASGFEA